MAIAPDYTETTRPAGPARLLPQGPIYDQALGVWSDVAGQLGADLDTLNRQLKVARQSVEANQREVDFSLGLQDVLSRSQSLTVTENGMERLADPDEQEGFFREQAEQLLRRYSDMPKADLETQARLRNSLVNEIAGGLGTLRKVQLNRQMKSIADTAEANVEKSYLSGNRALFEESLDDMVETGVISEGKREELKEAFPINSALAQATRLITDVRSGNPAEAAQMLAEILADEAITADQRADAARLLNLAESAMADQQKKAQSAVKYQQEQTKKSFVAKLANLGNPQAEQLTIAEVLASNLDASDQLQYIKLLATWEDDLFKDKPEVMADVLYRIQQGTITNKDIWGLVGQGVSPTTANQLTDPSSFYSDPGFRQADEFIKRNLGYQNDLIGWINPKATRWYDQAKNDLIKRIQREQLQGDAIRKAGYEISLPYLTQYWQEVMSMSPEEIRQSEEQIRALSGGGRPSNPAPNAPTPTPQKTEEQKVREIFGIR
jgi:hypothetical protein